MGDFYFRILMICSCLYFKNEKYSKNISPVCVLLGFQSPADGSFCRKI